jgi:hypothetical protein
VSEDTVTEAFFVRFQNEPGDTKLDEGNTELFSERDGIAEARRVLLDDERSAPGCYAVVWRAPYNESEIWQWWEWKRWKAFRRDGSRITPVSLSAVPIARQEHLDPPRPPLKEYALWVVFVDGRAKPQVLPLAKLEEEAIERWCRAMKRPPDWVRMSAMPRHEAIRQNPALGLPRPPRRRQAR